MSRILVIGGTGNVGRQLVPRLLTAGAQVRALVRDPDVADFPAGVEAMRGDLTRPETLDQCLAGIDTVFLVWVAPPATVAAVLERIVKIARRVVFLSAPLKTPHPFFQQPNPSRVLSEQIERLIEASGIEWTFLRPGMFASNALNFWGQQIRSGDAVRWPFLSVPTAPVDARDIAAVAVRALCEGGHAGAEYVLTGPESLSQLEQVVTVGRALNRTLHVEEITQDEARRELLSILPAPAIEMLLQAWNAASGHPAFLSFTIAEVTGAPARTFAEWARDHVAAFRG